MYNRIFKEWLLRPADLAREVAATYGPANRRYCLGAFDGARLVAHATARPARVVIEGAELKWSGYGNVMTDPEYRGRGIATRINTLIWGRLKADGFDGVYIS